MTYAPRNERYARAAQALAEAMAELQAKNRKDVPSRSASCYEEDRKLLAAKREELERMAERLLEKETLDEDDVRQILGSSEN